MSSEKALTVAQNQELEKMRGIWRAVTGQYGCGVGAGPISTLPGKGKNLSLCSGRC